MKTVLITGASSGIGKELAWVFAEHHYLPILVARRANLLNYLAEDIQKSFSIEPVIIVLDLAKQNSAEQLSEIIEQKKLSIDVLVNNAGFGDYSAFCKQSISRIESMMMLNMITLTKLCRLIAPQIALQGEGNILNIASTAAFQGIPNFAVYAATKAYVLSFSEAIAYELKPLNIHVTTVCPGATQSGFQEEAGMNENFFNEAPSSMLVAEFAFKAMQQNKTMVIYGAQNSFLNFMQRFVPRKLITKAAAKMLRS
ncbi:MAG TPA: short-chain dehydrogenase [Bacteroidales bacterium]|nr:short-chain dehydrogenase [Bacteroidales bacterium]